METETSASIHRFLKREGLGHLQSRAIVRAPVRKEVQRIGTVIAGKLRTARARIAYAPIIPFVAQLSASSLSARAIANALNRRGHRTQNGTRWSCATVLALQRRESLAAAAVPTGVRGGFRPEVQVLGVAAAATAKRLATRRHDARIVPLVDKLQLAGLGLREIAASLDATNLRMPSGKKWTVAQVTRLIQRCARASEFR